MATPPTFTTGAILTAAQMNTIGLFLVKTQTVGSAVTSVTVTSCFSADYDNYRVVISGVDFSSTAISWQLRVGGATADYYGSSYYDLYTGAGTGTLRTNAGGSLYFGVSDGDNASATFDVCRPYLTTITTFQGNFYGSGYSGWASGSHAANTSHTSLTLIAPSGTMTGGTIKIYGYRN